MTLQLDSDLPAAALIDRADQALTDTLAGSNAIWLYASEDAFESEADGVLTRWQARLGGCTADPTVPNEGHAQIGKIGDHVGLQCRAELNCGFVVDSITPDARRFSMAIVYVPSEEGDARTLLTVNTIFERESGKASGDYFFVTDTDGVLTAKDTGGFIELNMPAVAQPGKPRLLLVTLDGRRVALWTSDAGLAETEGLMPSLGFPAGLFIGCRSHRHGLKKKMGSALIRDVFFWPNNTLLFPRVEEDSRYRSALHQYFLWTT